MGFCGEKAVPLLQAFAARVEVTKKDATNKMWGYKLKHGRQREFAFDPKTTMKLVIRLDTKPPTMPGLSGAENIEFNSVSTALDRVFTGGTHRACWKVEVEDEYALVRLVEFLEKSS